LRVLVRLTSGAIAAPSNVASIAVQVTKQGGTITYTNASLVVATYLYANPLTTDVTFDDDTNDQRSEQGYNLHWLAPAAAFPTAGWYTVRFRFVGTDASITTKILEVAARGA